MKSFIKRKLEARVMVKTVIRIVAITVIIAAGTFTYLSYTVLPTFVEAATDWWEGEPVVYTKPVEQEINLPSPDRLDRYYEEEYSANEAKFEQARKDDARAKAIERLEKDLEAEKQQLRERELFQ